MWPGGWEYVEPAYDRDRVLLTCCGAELDGVFEQSVDIDGLVHGVPRRSISTDATGVTAPTR